MRARRRMNMGIPMIEKIAVTMIAQPVVGGAVLRHGTLYGPGSTDLFCRRAAQATVPGHRGWHRLRLMGARRRRCERCRPGCGEESEGHIQHRRRRTCPGKRVAAVS